MSDSALATVVVGVDGSSASTDAVALAAAEAARRAAALRIVHGKTGPVGGATGSPDRGPRLVRLAVTAARRAAPDVPIDGVVVPGPPVPALVAHAHDRALVVLGECGRRRSSRQDPGGSVARALACHGGVPLLVHHRSHSDPALPVLAGVAGGAGDDDVLRAAFAEADLRATGLVALHVHPNDPAAADAVAVEAVAMWREKYPDVEVRTVGKSGVDTTVALMAASRSAQLVVVGAPSRPAAGGGRPIVLALLHRAGCPVMVVPMGWAG